MAVRFPGCAALSCEFCWMVVERSPRRAGTLVAPGQVRVIRRLEKAGSKRGDSAGHTKNGALVHAWWMVSSAQVRNTLWHHCPLGHMIEIGGFVASVHASWQHLNDACDDMLST